MKSFVKFAQTNQPSLPHNLLQNQFIEYLNLISQPHRIPFRVLLLLLLLLCHAQGTPPLVRHVFLPHQSRKPKNQENPQNPKNTKNHKTPQNPKIFQILKNPKDPKNTKNPKNPKNGRPDLDQAQCTGLSARRVRRRKSRGPKGLQLEAGAQRAPRLLVTNIDTLIP